MKRNKYILFIFVLMVVFSLQGCKTSKSDNKDNTNNRVYDLEDTMNSVYEKLNLKENFKNVPIKSEPIYVVILDTGVQEAYAQSFYESKYSCMAKIVSYNNNSIFSTESRHGTLMQQLFDEMSIRAGTIKKVNTIHLKIKENDDEKVSVDRILNLMNQVISLKKKGYDIRVLNISQTFSSKEDDYSKVADKIQLLKENGILIVAAAGNNCKNNLDSNIFAKSKDVIIVGGIDLKDNLWNAGENEGSPCNDRINIYSYAAGINLGEKIPYFSEKVTGTSYSSLILSWIIANYELVNDSIKIDDILDNISSMKNNLRIIDVDKLCKEIK